MRPDDATTEMIGGSHCGLEEITKISGLGTRWSLRWDPFESFQVQSNARGARESQDSAQANDGARKQRCVKVWYQHFQSIKKRKAPWAPIGG